MSNSSSAASSAFSSVKLPAALVQKAKEAAGPLRRSTAGQIEYWATLGRIAEHSGLTAQESREAIEVYEAAARETHLANALDDIEADYSAVEGSGRMAERVRDVAFSKRTKAIAVKKAT